DFDRTGDALGERAGAKRAAHVLLGIDRDAQPLVTPIANSMDGFPIPHLEGERWPSRMSPMKSCQKPRNSVGRKSLRSFDHFDHPRGKWMGFLLYREKRRPEEGR